MGNRWKRIVALLMSSAMCMTMMPSLAFAATESEEPATNAGEEVAAEVPQEVQADDVAVIADDEIAIDESNFPDDNFRAYVEKNFDKDGSETLSEEEIANAKTISIGNYQSLPDSSTLCTSLDGIEYFTELEYLDCSGNMLYTLDVSNSPHLKTLYCDSNTYRPDGRDKGKQLETLNISNNSELVYLSVFNNDLTELDLSGKTKLQELNCADNYLTSLDLSDCGDLTFIDCSNNPYLTELDVSNLTHLQTLFAYLSGDYMITGEEGLQSLTLGDLPELTRLECEDNLLLTDLDVSGCPNLTVLKCSACRLSELDLSNQGDNWITLSIGSQFVLVDAIASDDSLAVPLEGLVSLENIGNVTPIEPAVLEDGFLMMPDLTAEEIDYNYVTPYGDMEVHLFINDTYQLDIDDCDADVDSCIYNGGEQTPEVTVTDGDDTLVEGTDYTVSYSDNVDAGFGTVTITGMGFYTGEIIMDFKIKPADIKTAATVNVTADDLVYNASRQDAGIVVTAQEGDETVVLEKGEDYEIKGHKAKAAGKHTATITGIGNYAGTTTVNYKIAKADQKLTAKVKKNDTKKYTIKASKLKNGSKSFKLAVTKKGKMKVRYSTDNSRIKVSKDGKVTLKKGLKKGTYKIKVTTGASKNYKANKTPIYITVKVQ